MRSSEYSQYVVLSARLLAGERFALCRLDALFAQFAGLSLEDMTDPAQIASRFTALAWISEADVRARLSAVGWPSSAIDEGITAARRRADVSRSAPTTIERITRIGYRNRDGQEVIRKTGLPGVAGQRVYVMRCSVCGHEYGAYGCDADIRRCPNCQDGPPGVPAVTDTETE
jgi:hypothetical protein